jgi:hypothetical protein
MYKRQPPQQRKAARREDRPAIQEKQEPKKPREEDTFDMSKRRATKRQQGLYSETEGVKKGGLRAALKVGDDHKFTTSQLTPLLKVEPGKKFTFQRKEFVMTEKMKKQIQLAVNMLRN